MHHYGEDSTEVTASDSSFHVVFRNKATGQLITMHIPRVGATGSGASPTDQHVKDVANEISHILRQRLV